MGSNELVKTGPNQWSRGSSFSTSPRASRSRNLVNQVARLLPRTKVGHAGTLDPLATGILIVCVGPATRLVQNVQDLPKAYRTLIRLGARSDTLDADGRIEIEASPKIPSTGEIQEAIRPLVGLVTQTPPDFSAKKIQGKRAYDLARAGQIARAGAPTGADRPDRRDRLRLAASRARRSIAAAAPTSDRSPAISARLSVAEGLSRRWFAPEPARSRSSRPSIPQRSRPNPIAAQLRPALDAVPNLPRLTLDPGQVEAIRPGQAAADSRFAR